MTVSELGIDGWLGPYRLLRRRAEDGLGAVYDAEDARLGRNVTLKTLRRKASSLRQRERLLREARVAASLRHPAICQVFEVGEAEGELFVAMESLDGEPLAARLTRGALPVNEGVPLVLELLGALSALHRLGLVHRGLTPSSVFLTPFGLKLLDVGLAEPQDETGGQAPQDGAAIPASGTPPYLAPEQLSGGPCDARTDIWASGMILYEAIAGHRPFDGTRAEVAHRVLHEPIPPLAQTGSPPGVELVVQRALGRRPADRFESAEAMADALRSALEVLQAGAVLPPSRLPRLVVLPFRVLRADEEVAFLASSLADAISTSLSSLGSLIVRSSLVGARLGADPLDLASIAERAGVDVVVTGTLLRAGQQVRLSVQLLEVPGGTLLGSQTRQLPVDQLFELQDDVARCVVEALAQPLTSPALTPARDLARPSRDVPKTPRVYEAYLRANQLAYDTVTWPEARRLYEQCVGEDPEFAPAWARLGRMYRVEAKYGLAPDAADALARAEAAFTKALALNPDLPLAHSYYAALEIDMNRVEQAMVRLLTRAAGRPGDAELMVGLVQACRFCGLLEASAAAHVHARRIDPFIQTSVLHTWWMMGEYGRVLDETERGTDPIKGLVLALMGRTDEARQALVEEERRFVNKAMSEFTQMVRRALEGDSAGAIGAASALEALIGLDPEGTYHVGRVRAMAGDGPGALAAITRAVGGGFFCSRILRNDPWLDAIRSAPEFAGLVAAAVARERAAWRLFRDAGGETLLGVAVQSDLASPTA
jgi:serine/threonine protein kinase